MGTLVHARLFLGIILKLSASTLEVTPSSAIVLFLSSYSFNLLKGVIVTLLTMLLYKRISPLLHKGDAKLQERSSKKKS